MSSKIRFPAPVDRSTKTSLCPFKYLFSLWWGRERLTKIKPMKYDELMKTTRKKLLKNAPNGLVVQDCRPFSAVIGAGFKNLVKFFLKIGAVNGLLPDPTTLSRKAKSDAEEKRSQILSEIKKKLWMASY
ncbi:uncharacterized protein LOC120284359 [Drosophila simulans]|uniref:uncharacterized protein LOC120284359 n=1 Tax=Drosophila simulans TaxID=7240 RepID=UPI00192CFD7E|nr:uncharacterized protein LOC120284359 [Drosophila simulans]